MTNPLRLRPSSSHRCCCSSSSQIRGWRRPRTWLLLLATAFWCTTTHRAAAEDTGGIGGGIDDSGIVGGTTVLSIDEYPYFATNAGAGLCGAALIASDILITAAHCGPSIFRLPKDVYIGLRERGGTDAREQITIEDTWTHPNFNRLNYDNDVMLLKLATNSAAPLVPLNTDSSVPAPGANVTTIGFGRLEYQGSLPDTLQKVTLPVVDYDTCEARFGSGVTDAIKICAGGATQDACSGDSGGPLIDDATGALVGIVSSGYQCAVPDYPGIYTRITGVTDFIQQGVCVLSNNPPFDCSGITAAPITSPTPAPSPFPSVPSNVRNTDPTAAPQSILIAAPTIAPVEAATSSGQSCPEDQCIDDEGYEGETVHWNILFGLFCWELPCVTSAFFRAFLRVIGFQCGGCLDVLD